MLINKYKEIFVAQRLDHPAEFWQMPQGGIDEGETAEEAVFRELKEEIGTNKIKIIAKASKTYKYDIPSPLNGKLWKGKYRGQEQTWFLARFDGTDDDINIETEHPEFLAWRWAHLDELLEVVVHFKKEVYKAVIEEFGDYLKRS